MTTDEAPGHDLIDRMTKAHRTIENAVISGGATRTAGLHRHRAGQIMDVLAEAISEFEPLRERIEQLERERDKWKKAADTLAETAESLRVEIEVLLQGARP